MRRDETGRRPPSRGVSIDKMTRGNVAIIFVLPVVVVVIVIIVVVDFSQRGLVDQTRLVCAYSVYRFHL